VTARAAVRETRWRGEPALALHADGTSAVFLPMLGMTGVSLRSRGREFLATPGGPDALRGGHTLGLPLLAPWANRLALRRFRVGRIDVDLRRRRVHADANGLPIHGLLVGAPGWRVTEQHARGGTATVRAAVEIDARAFPFPHCIEVEHRLTASGLRVSTTIVPTGRRRVPVAFGWHPYLRVGGPRRAWQLELPARTRLALDARGLPTGTAAPERAERAAIATRTFDDLYALGGRRRLALTGADGSSVAVVGDAAYPFAQVWVPPGRPFAALEPMTVPTNALVGGTTPFVEPGDEFTARFRIELDAIRTAGSRARPR
jgi:galactose mutarotase-like enzyme